MKHLWIVYDERAETEDTDDCAVLEACSSEQEAMHQAQPGIVFKYDVKPAKPRDELVNETRIGANYPLQRERQKVIR